MEYSLAQKEGNLATRDNLGEQDLTLSKMSQIGTKGQTLQDSRHVSCLQQSKSQTQRWNAGSRGLGRWNMRSC